MKIYAWPKYVFCVGEIPSDDPEVRKEIQTYKVVNIAEQEDGVMNRLITRCSDLNKLKKPVAWLLLFKLGSSGNCESRLRTLNW